MENYIQMKHTYIIFILGLILTFQSQSVRAQETTPEQYIQTFKDIAILEMHTYKIPASITLAQGILESGNGNSKLAKEANNHFGIKCHKDWEGGKFYQDDDEKDECFRVYDNPEESYKDHSLFLSKKQRYAFLFEYKTDDYKAWAKGLKKAGYATNPKYPTLLVNLIERYDLSQYDKISPKDHKKTVEAAGKRDVAKNKNVKGKEKPVSQDKVQEKKKNKNSDWELDSIADPDKLTLPAAGRQTVLFHNIKYVEYQKNDNLDKISSETGIDIKLLYKYNDVTQDTKLIKGDKIFLQPKRSKGTTKLHIVKGNETLWEISQRYGIRLKSLYKRNHIPVGTQKVKAGTKLWLQGKKPIEILEEERKDIKIENGEIKAD